MSASTGKLVPAGYTALETEEIARLVLCLDKFGCLDVLDKNQIIGLIAGHQVFDGQISAGRRQIKDAKILNGLFFTQCDDPIRDTGSSLMILQKLGGLSRIDREACINGILRFHQGRGLFQEPVSGTGLAVFGDSRDTIAAYESLRILGTVDRIKDLPKWEFRSFLTSQKIDPNGQRVATWDEIEAWLCQQRLQKILGDHKANPSQPYRSLLEP